VAKQAKQKRNILGGLLLLALLILVGLHLMNLQEDIAAAEAEKSALAAQIAAAEQEKASLEDSLEKSEDQEYLQELAREQLGMVTSGQKDFYDISN